MYYTNYKYTKSIFEDFQLFDMMEIQFFNSLIGNPHLEDYMCWNITALFCFIVIPGIFQISYVGFPSAFCYNFPVDLGAEGGVSTSEGDTLHREPPTIMVTRAEQSNEESTQDSEENFTEADSMAAEVGEDDIDEEEEETRRDADDEGN